MNEIITEAFLERIEALMVFERGFSVRNDLVRRLVNAVRAHNDCSRLGPLEMNVYQALCMRTAGKFDSPREALTAGAICIAGEAGELANAVKKMIWHGHPIDNEKVMDELGDVLWYVARLGQDMGMSLEDIARHNLAKLAKRYPEGFDPERSRNRVE